MPHLRRLLPNLGGGLLCALALTLPLAVLLVASPARAIETGREFTYQNWAGDSYVDDDTGAFSHCAVAAEYHSDISLAFAIDREHDLAIALSHLDWQIPETGLGEVMLVIDGTSLGVFSITRVTENSIGIWFEQPQPYMDALRRGNSLEVRAERDTFNFELTGTHRALSMLEDCVRYELTLEEGLNRNPFGDSSENPFSEQGEAPAESDITDAEFSQGMKQLLQDAGFTDVQMMSEGANVAFTDATAAWTQETYTGGLYLFDLADTDPNEILDGALAEGKGSCEGMEGYYVAGSDAGNMMGRIGIREGQGVCRFADDGGSFFHVSVIVDETVIVSILQYYVFAGNEEGDQIIEAARRIGPFFAALLNE